jgi:hypothetical protein
MTKRTVSTGGVLIDGISKFMARRREREAQKAIVALGNRLTGLALKHYREHPVNRRELTLAVVVMIENLRVALSQKLPPGHEPSGGDSEGA